MDEKEKSALLQRILQVASDPKGARIAAKTFINRCQPDDATPFLAYVDSSDLVARKMARYILGQMGCPFALDPLLKLLDHSLNGLTFMPDEEYKENHFFANIIEVLETIYGIVRSNRIRQEALHTRLLDVFIKTRHEDLRFSLIKLIALLGESADYFLGIYSDLSNKEKRALYHVYAFVESPRRLDFFRLGLEDPVNQEFVIPNMMEFPDGRELLKSSLSRLADKEKVFFLTQLLEQDATDFLDPLIEMLEDENRQVIQLASENIKAIDFQPFPLERFLEKIKTGYSFEMMKAMLSIFAHFVQEGIETHLLDAMAIQALYSNKALILEAILKAMKNHHNLDLEFSRRISKVLLDFFQTYSEDRIDFFVTILKVLPSLSFTQSIQIKTVKKELMVFLKHNENQISQTLINNLQGCIARLNQLISRLEEVEEKIKHIEVLFDLDVTVIDATRLEKLRLQLADVVEFHQDFRQRFNLFLMKLLEHSTDWKVRSGAAELLADFGEPGSMAVLKEKQEGDQSLGVRVACSKAMEQIRARHKVPELTALVIEPLFYINKLICDSLRERSFSVVNAKSWPADNEWTDPSPALIWIADHFLDENTEERVKAIRERLEKGTLRVVIVTAKPERLAKFRTIQGVKLLRKPFTKEQLERYYEGVT